MQLVGTLQRFKSSGPLLRRFLLSPFKRKFAQTLLCCYKYIYLVSSVKLKIWKIRSIEKRNGTLRRKLRRILLRFALRKGKKKKKKEALARIYIYIHTNDWISHFIVNNRNG